MKLTKKQAKELSIKKWEYIVGNKGNSNGLTDKYPELKELAAECGYCEKSPLDCEGCPLNLKGIVCTNKSHPWAKWSYNRTIANAQKVLDLIRES